MPPTYDTTTKHALRSLQGSNLVSDIDAGFAALADDLDGIVAVDDQGTFASRPTSTPGTPGVPGRYYYATDTGQLFRDYGTGWTNITPERILASATWSSDHVQTVNDTSTLHATLTFTPVRPTVRVEAWWPFIRDVRGGAGSVHGPIQVDSDPAIYAASIDISSGGMGTMVLAYDLTLSLAQHTILLFTAVGSEPVTAEENGTGYARVIQR